HHADGFFLELRRELPTTPRHVPTSSRLLSAYVANCPESAGHLMHTLIDRLPGSIRYLGAPGEERGCGKELLAREGAFEGVDAAMMVHPASWDLKAVRTACIAEVTVVLTGHASHAAVKPEAGRNALDAAVLSYQAIAQLRQHIQDKERVHGVITEGGGAPNVVPGRAACHYFVRAANARELSDLKARVEACFHGAALASGCTADVQWAEADYLDMRVNEPLADAYEANATLLGREFTPYEQFPAGGTDMANVSHHVPVLHPTIACAPPDVMIHEPEFAAWAASKRGEQALADGAKALAMTAIDFLQDQTLRRRTQAAFASAHAPAA
ncbi:MAG TPA: amidohydrolase, partial [Nonomuraea sp.]|nr:amidohydrolase [Nonomuraea sp.]